ncbi:unnamed protein product [Ixodes persulcatus]
MLSGNSPGQPTSELGARLRFVLRRKLRAPICGSTE